MKFRFLVLGLMAILAGGITAHVFKPLPDKARASARPAEQSQAPSTALPSQVVALTAPSAVASDETRSPVPVRLAPRRPFVPLVEAPRAASPPLNADTPPPSNMTEIAAKAAIEADGYRGVRALARGPDGAWKASAWRGQTEVLLTVGPTGNVSAN